MPRADPDAALTAVRTRWFSAKVGQADREVARNPAAAAALACLPVLTVASTPSEVMAVAMARSRIIGRLHEANRDPADMDEDAAWQEAFQAELHALDDLAATPARTLAGLAFKMDVLACEYHDHCGLQDSVAADIRAFAAAHPALALPPAS